MSIYVTLEPGGQDTQDIRADLALYLGSKLKLKQEEGLKGETKSLICHSNIKIKNTNQRVEYLLLEDKNMSLVKWL